MPEEKQRLRGLQAARLVLSVCFCIGLALFIWLQVGTCNLANRLTAIGYIVTGTTCVRLSSVKAPLWSSAPLPCFRSGGPNSPGWGS